ncbi:hypothetical protein GCM10010251_55930 [Streptomyces aurantiogriseus]|uniref:Uncharacterized protein n=1 Tax=Streptomyces aurantiogriseus TaxID=66870 RepID=A0A918CNU3_9ACTN|nr:hypothetical protein GCM10010251_55930 [Streptomyces aurantiogriseus]
MKYPAHTASSGAQDRRSDSGAHSGEGSDSPLPADSANATAPTPSRPRDHIKSDNKGYVFGVAGAGLLTRLDWLVCEIGASPTELGPVGAATAVECAVGVTGPRVPLVWRPASPAGSPSIRRAAVTCMLG